MHHKVAAKAYCVFGLEDAAWSARQVVVYLSHVSLLMNSQGARTLSESRWTGFASVDRYERLASSRSGSRARHESIGANASSDYEYWGQVRGSQF